ncbi:MAG: YafY family protein [bacterium]
MGMAKYDRLLFILNLLRSRRNLNAERLAEECGVTERSIYRDIVALSEANIPIYYDNGYKLASDYFLPPLNLDYEEYLAVRLSIQSSPLFRLGKYHDALRKALVKLDAVISDSVRKQSRFTPPTTHIEIPTTLEQERCAEHYGSIEQAVSESRCLRLEYESIRSGISERIVEPYFIVFRGRAFYFVAKCHLRDDIRTFRLDRVHSLKLTEQTFLKPDNITAESYFRDSWGVYSGEPVQVIVRLRGPAARVVQSTVHQAGESVMEEGDSAVIYTVTTRGTEEIQRWILGFAEDAEVLAPKSLRTKIHDQANAMSELYAKGCDG